MQIQNPIASQYVFNQGLTARLNTAPEQLPVKATRFDSAITDIEQQKTTNSQNNKSYPNTLISAQPEKTGDTSITAQNFVVNSRLPAENQEQQPQGSANNQLQLYQQINQLESYPQNNSTRIDYFI